MMLKKLPEEILNIKKVLNGLRKEGKILLAYLYGSFAKNTQHKRSDIDLAVFYNVKNEVEAMEITDKIQIATDKHIELLRLDDEDESPFVVQEALKGIPLVDADVETFYRVSIRVLHEAEGIRFKRETL